MEIVAISTLSPESPLSSECGFKAVVTLLWPFSSATGQCALLLADPDARRRYQKGQVRVRFTGPSARVIATSGIGIGDEVEIALSGAQWLTEALVKTPGKSVDGELLFKNRLRLSIRRADGQVKIVEADETDQPQSPKSSMLPPSTPISRPSARPSFDAYGVAVYSSPAFMKRLRLSEGNTTYTPVQVSDDDDLDTNASRKRRRVSYKNVVEWKFDTREPSPEQDSTAPVNAEGEVPSEQPKAAAQNVDEDMQDAVETTKEPEKAAEHPADAPSEEPTAESQKLDDNSAKAAEEVAKKAAEVQVETETEAAAKAGELPSALREPIPLEEFTTDTTPNVPSEQVVEPEKQAQEVASEASTTTLLNMPPPSLPRLEIPSTGPGGPQEVSSVQDGEGPTTPVLQPVAAENLPLPSPFPTSANQIPSPSFSQVLKAAETFQEEQKAEEVQEPTETNEKEATTKKQKFQGVNAFQQISDKQTEKELTEVGLSADDIRAAQEEESKTSESEDYEAEFEEPEDSQQQEPAAETDARETRIIPDTYEAFDEKSSQAGSSESDESAPGSSPLIENVEFLRRSRGDADEESSEEEDEQDVEMVSPSEGAEADVSSEADYDNEKIAELQEESDQEVAEEPDWDYLESKLEQEEEELGLRRAMSKEVEETDDTMMHDSASNSVDDMDQRSDDDSGEDESAYGNGPEGNEQTMPVDSEDESSEGESYADPNDLSYQPSFPTYVTNDHPFGLDGAALSRETATQHPSPSQEDEFQAGDETVAWADRDAALQALNQNKQASATEQAKGLPPAADSIPPPSSRMTVIELSESDEEEETQSDVRREQNAPLPVEQQEDPQLVTEDASEHSGTDKLEQGAVEIQAKEENPINASPEEAVSLATQTEEQPAVEQAEQEPEDAEVERDQPDDAPLIELEKPGKEQKPMEDKAPLENDHPSPMQMDEPSRPFEEETAPQTIDNHSLIQMKESIAAEQEPESLPATDDEDMRDDEQMVEPEASFVKEAMHAGEELHPLPAVDNEDVGNDEQMVEPAMDEPMLQEPQPLSPPTDTVEVGHAEQEVKSENELPTAPAEEAFSETEVKTSVEVGPEILDPAQPGFLQPEAPILAPESAQRDLEESRPLTSSSFKTLSPSPHTIQPVASQAPLSQFVEEIEEIDLSQVEPESWSTSIFSQSVRRAPRTEPVPDSVDEEASVLVPGSSRASSRRVSPVLDMDESLQTTQSFPTEGLVLPSQELGAFSQFDRPLQKGNYRPSGLQSQISSVEEPAPSYVDMEQLVEEFARDDKSHAGLDDELLADYVEVSPQPIEDVHKAARTANEPIISTTKEIERDKEMQDASLLESPTSAQAENEDVYNAKIDVEEKTAPKPTPNLFQEKTAQAQQIKSSANAQPITLEKPRASPETEEAQAEANMQAAVPTPQLQTDVTIEGQVETTKISTEPLEKITAPSPDLQKDSTHAPLAKPQNEPTTSPTRQLQHPTTTPAIAARAETATPARRTSAAQSTWRRSLSSRMSEVPEIISAWFTPRKTALAQATTASKRKPATGDVESEEETPIKRDGKGEDENAGKVVDKTEVESSTGISAKPMIETPTKPAAKADPGSSMKVVEKSPVKAVLTSSSTKKQRQASISPPPLSRLASQGTSTALTYFTPLTALPRSLNQPDSQIDIFAICISPSSAPERAKSGPKDFYTIFHIVDQGQHDWQERIAAKTKAAEAKGLWSPSQANKNDGIRVEVFRPWKASLPVAEKGDVVLLRGFCVRSRGHRPYLLSNGGSAWCVWRYAEASNTADAQDDKPIWARKSQAERPGSAGSLGELGVREEIKGPPVEVGDGERNKVVEVRTWWEGLQAPQKQDVEMQG